MDQASTPCSAELNPSLTHTLDDAAIHERIVANVALLETLAAEIDACVAQDRAGPRAPQAMGELLEAMAAR